MFVVLQKFPAPVTTTGEGTSLITTLVAVYKYIGHNDR